MTKLKIGIALAWENGPRIANAVGDHYVAMAWKKYLERRDDVASVAINAPGAYASDVTHLVHMQHWLPLHPTAKNVLYMQNAWDGKTPVPTRSFRDYTPSAMLDTVGVFREYKGLYDAFLFPSQGLMDACHDNPDSLVLPFACDHELMRYEYDEKYAAPVVFVGNDIRGEATNERYLIPALPKLHLYGGPFRDPRLQAVHKGKVPQEDLHKVYSSARVMLDVTHGEWKKHGLANQRVYDILACGGTVLTDNQAVNTFFPTTVTMGDEDTSHWIRILSNLPDTEDDEAIRQDRRDFILSAHTYEHRVADLMAWLKELV